MNVLANSIPRRKASRVLPFFIVLLAMLVPSLAHAQQQPNLDALAAKTAGKIRKSAKVLVIDFSDSHAKSSLLGAVLTDEFAAALRNTSRGLVVIDRADYARAAAEDVLMPEARAGDQAAKCYSEQLGADFAVEGTINASSEATQLNVKVMRLSDWKRILETTASVPLTPEFRASLSKPVSSPSVTSHSSKNTWNNPSSPLGTSDLATAKWPDSLKASVPTCIYCPSAHFTDAAVKAKAQGTVDLNVVIDPEGHVASMSVMRGLPCGLNSQAIEAVKEWRLKPATDPNGNPVTFRTTVEMTFHLY